jgi:hypothetical protein
MPEPVIDADFVQFPGWESLSPGLQRQFLDAHLPATFLSPGLMVHFAAGPDLVEVDVPDLGPRMLRFGRRAGRGPGAPALEHYYRDPATGHVFIADDDGSAAFVNSDLAAMAATMRLVTGLSEQILHGDGEALSAAATTFRTELTRIDEPAEDLGNHWGAFASDFEDGNYSDHRGG